jgi:hypothetical protein
MAPEVDAVAVSLLHGKMRERFVAGTENRRLGGVKPPRDDLAGKMFSLPDARQGNGRENGHC